MIKVVASLQDILQDISYDPTLLNTVFGKEEVVTEAQILPRGYSTHEQAQVFFQIKEYKEYLDVKKLIPLYRAMAKTADTEEERQKFRDRLIGAENKLQELKEWATTITPVASLENIDSGGTIDSLSLDLEADRRFEQLQRAKGSSSEREARAHFVKTQVRLAERQEIIAMRMKKHSTVAQEAQEDAAKNKKESKTNDTPRAQAST